MVLEGAALLRYGVENLFRTLETDAHLAHLAIEGDLRLAATSAFPLGRGRKKVGEPRGHEPGPVAVRARVSDDDAAALARRDVDVGDQCRGRIRRAGERRARLAEVIGDAFEFHTLQGLVYRLD